MYRNAHTGRQRSDSLTEPMSKRTIIGITSFLAGAALLTLFGHLSVSRLVASSGQMHTLGRAPEGVGESDGVIADSVAAFDEVPAVARLQPDLRTALRRAAGDAARDGVVVRINSGWRSAAYQERLWQQAVSKYGTAAEAARWVAPPDRSAHEFGEAVDVGGPDATAWLSRHGAAYGLCRIYHNEPWHYELRAGAADHGCPTMYADAAHDPRMQH
jgi:hypothetical protein